MLQLRQNDLVALDGFVFQVESNNVVSYEGRTLAISMSTTICTDYRHVRPMMIPSILYS